MGGRPRGRVRTGRLTCTGGRGGARQAVVNAANAHASSIASAVRVEFRRETGERERPEGQPEIA